MKTESPVSQRSAPKSIDVLVVDDSSEFCRLVARALGKHGRTVMSAPSALHAVRVLERREVRLVLTDMNMPGPLGTVLLEQVERLWPTSRRVLMSADVSGQLVNGARSAHRIIDKFSFVQLIEGVLEELEDARP